MPVQRARQAHVEGRDEEPFPGLDLTRRSLQEPQKARKVSLSNRWDVESCDPKSAQIWDHPSTSGLPVVPIFCRDERCTWRFVGAPSLVASCTFCTANFYKNRKALLPRSGVIGLFCSFGGLSRETLLSAYSTENRFGFREQTDVVDKTNPPVISAVLTRELQTRPQICPTQPKRET